jgi:hypothetical protein
MSRVFPSQEQKVAFAPCRPKAYRHLKLAGVVAVSLALLGCSSWDTNDPMKFMAFAPFYLANRTVIGFGDSLRSPEPQLTGSYAISAVHPHEVSLPSPRDLSVDQETTIPDAPNWFASNSKEHGVRVSNEHFSASHPAQSGACDQPSASPEIRVDIAFGKSIKVVRDGKELPFVWPRDTRPERALVESGYVIVSGTDTQSNLSSVTLLDLRSGTLNTIHLQSPSSLNYCSIDDRRRFLALTGAYGGVILDLESGRPVVEMRRADFSRLHLDDYITDVQLERDGTGVAVQIGISRLYIYPIDLAATSSP